MAENTSNAPVASKLIFLHQLNEQPLNAKVRFLCCVVDYDEQTGCLTVEHKYPRIASGQVCTSAVVDINLILETVKRPLLQAGSWVNVIGYVQSISAVKRRVSSSRTVKQQDMRTNLPKVQAVLFWDAGALRLDKYEEAIEQHLALVVS
ncbi:hypothetical protein PMZ80_005341 [Knufia obscura]|uniref:CST complex subunit Ten1 n=2 Tax=Knufia TaxID=430999 RepID=A0AAN8I8W5_9EURO|nr:hypothetical protein PMZ80_005341 [Knufia obscura]KAK5958009.1 hypothetical protein OHC33_001199 [Knufia fluminis]